MQRVLVLATNKQPLMPCHPARARRLLRDGKAAIFRHYPFTIILMHREGGEVQATALKIDLHIQATGHGSRQLCRTDQYGFPSRHRLRQKRHFGFQTGDIVRSDVKTGKYGGLHTGRVACRATGRFDLKTAAGKVTVKHTTCRLIHRSDGYTYTLKGEGSASSPR